MISGFNFEILQLSSTDKDSSLTIVIQKKSNPLDLFNSLELNAITNATSNLPIITYSLPIYRNLFDIIINGTEFIIELQISNLTIYKQQQWISTNFLNFTSGILMSESHFPFNELPIGEEITFSSNEEVFKIPLMGYYKSIDSIGQAILLDFKSTKLPKYLENKFNSFEVEFTDKSGLEIMENLIIEFPSLMFQPKQSTGLFLEVSAENIIQTLRILHLVLNVLQVLVITYVFYLLVKDSEKEIRILKSIGYSRKEIIALFLGQAIMLGIISSIISILASVFIIHFLFALLAAFTTYPFILSIIPFNEAVNLVIQTIAVCIIAIMFPISKFVN